MVSNKSKTNGLFEILKKIVEQIRYLLYILNWEIIKELFIFFSIATDDNSCTK